MLYIYNFYMDQELDKQKPMTSRDNNPAYWQDIIALLESLNLADSWRIQNPKTRRYTWHSRGKSSRLDYIFISEHLLKDINNCSIQSGLHSDHSIVNLELNSDKFNNTLLHDNEYVNLIKKTINDCKTSLNNYTDKGLVWESMKLKNRSVSIPYCIKKKKNMYTFKNDLIKDMNLLQIELGNDPSTINQEKFITSKHELEQIEKYETHGHIMHMDWRWRKQIDIFHEPRKKIYCNKLITSLEVNGKIIKDEKIFYQNLYSETLNSSDTSYKESLNNNLINNKQIN